MANRGRAMMHHANLPMMDRYCLAHEAFQCATHLDRLTVVEVNGVVKTRYEHFIGQNPMFAKHLRTWGEAGTVKIKTNTSPKLNDKKEHTVCSWDILTIIRETATECTIRKLAEHEKHVTSSG